ncbi:MAG TPA: phage tail protein [Kofleriaceae bacterium]|nr:phage tail protein [Kofleriaceae bacterium]
MANQQPRAYAAAHFALELDGKDEVGLFRSIEGGSIKADVMQYQTGAHYDRWRQLGKPKFEDFKVQVGMSMSKPFYDWIAKFFNGEAERKTGAIVAADFYYVERARREFKEAIIKELVFPKLDGQDKGAAYMSIAVAVEEMVFKKGEGKKLSGATGFNRQKLWTANNFRFKLDGFGEQCKRVSKIDSFTVKQNIAEHHVGGFRAPIKCPTQIDFPQITFYVPESDAQPFWDHFTKRAVKGEVPGRLTGSIQTYDNDGRDLFTLSFEGADIANIQPDKLDAGSEEIKQIKIDLYTEKMKFEYLAMSVE